MLYLVCLWQVYSPVAGGGTEDDGIDAPEVTEVLTNDVMKNDAEIPQ